MYVSRFTQLRVDRNSMPPSFLKFFPPMLSLPPLPITFSPHSEHPLDFNF
jgi:hypothetical protein